MKPFSCYVFNTSVDFDFTVSSDSKCVLFNVLLNFKMSQKLCRARSEKYEGVITVEFDV